MSKDASFDLYLHRGLLFVGSTGDPWDEPELLATPSEGRLPAVLSTNSHVMIRVRAQIALVRVEIWDRNAPIVGEVVFDGILDLPDGILSVSEFDKLNWAQKKVGTRGEHRITIRVDDRGEASRVIVIRDRAEGERRLTAVAGHELPPMTIAADEDLSPAADLGFILSAHDLPLSRLAAAIKLLLVTRGEPSKYSVMVIVEWLRWLHPAVRAADCRALGEQLLADLADFADASTQDDLDERSLRTARGLLHALDALGGGQVL